MEYPGERHPQPRLTQRRGGGAPGAGVAVGGPRGGGNGPTVTLPRTNLNGDDIHVGRRGGSRRRTRSSQSESQGSGAEGEEEEEWAHGSPTEGVSFYGPQGERVWYGRGPPQAHHLPSSSAPSSSSRTQATRGSRTLTFRSRRPQPPPAPPAAPEEELRSSYPRRPQPERRSSSSEPYRGRGRGYRGGARRRGFSETEGRPRRDNVIMSGLQCLAQETIWFDKSRYDEAERRFYEGANGPAPQSSSHSGGDHQDLVSRMKSLEVENKGLHKVVEDLRAALSKLESRVSSLEKTPSALLPCAKAVVVAAPVQTVRVVQNGDEEEDEDFDLFGSDEEEDDAEAERIKEERVKEYAARKANKPVLIAKSSILLDVKPWDDETDMAKLEECVRSVQMEGLLWGQSKLVPVGYGIKKLQIGCVVEDDKVGTDILEEEITKYEDYVQSVDIAAFNKI